MLDAPAVPERAGLLFHAAAERELKRIDRLAAPSRWAGCLQGALRHGPRDGVVLLALPVRHLAAELRGPDVDALDSDRATSCWRAGFARTGTLLYHAPIELRLCEAIAYGAPPEAA